MKLKVWAPDAGSIPARSTSCTCRGGKAPILLGRRVHLMGRTWFRRGQELRPTTRQATAVSSANQANANDSAFGVPALKAA